MSERRVHCCKLGAELPGLEKPPFAGELGQKIFENVSQQAWDMWAKDMQVKVLNEYRLNMGKKEDYETLLKQMTMFLCLDDVEVLEVENEQRGRGE